MLLSIRFVIPSAIIIYEDRILPSFNKCVGQPPKVHEDFDENISIKKETCAYKIDHSCTKLYNVFKNQSFGKYLRLLVYLFAFIWACVCIGAIYKFRD